MNLTKQELMEKPSDKTINAVLHGLASNEDASLVSKWFATDEGQEYLSNDMNCFFFSMKEGYEEISTPHPIPSEKIWNKIENKTFHKRKQHLILKIAVILVPFLFVTGIAIQMGRKTNLFGNEKYTEIYVPKGERMEITLADGTHVYLNADTKLQYPEKFGHSSRKVTLEGEAYFDVTRDENHPFIIELPGKTAIEVLGTAFNVKAYSCDDKISVALDNGKINMISSNNKKHTLLPQEKLVYKKDADEFIVSKNQNTESDSEWRNDVISFNDATLSEVIEVLNRYYNINFEIENTAALGYSYTLTTKKTSIEKLLFDFEKISPVKFVIENNTVKVGLK